MKLALLEITNTQWLELAPSAHRSVFGEILPPEYDRIDFAVLVIDELQNRPVGYVTARELDQESVYLKHGGAFPPMKDTIYSWHAYKKTLEHLLTRYTRITTLVENTNTVYLKMALTAGFKVIGVRYFKNTLLVELFIGKEF